MSCHHNEYKNRTVDLQNFNQIKNSLRNTQYFFVRFLMTVCIRKNSMKILWSLFRRFTAGHIELANICCGKSEKIIIWTFAIGATVAALMRTCCIFAWNRIRAAWIFNGSVMCIARSSAASAFQTKFRREKKNINFILTSRWFVVLSELIYGCLCAAICCR